MGKTRGDRYEGCIARMRGFTCRKVGLRCGAERLPPLGPAGAQVLQASGKQRRPHPQSLHEGCAAHRRRRDVPVHGLQLGGGWGERHCN